jgi:hypothetical protein
MIRIAANLDWNRFEPITDAAKIFVKLVFDLLINERLPVLRTKDDVQVIGCE